MAGQRQVVDEEWNLAAHIEQICDHPHRVPPTLLAGRLLGKYARPAGAWKGKFNPSLLR